jgi:O-antigen/teichoic acid export membrane protein
MPTFTFVLFAKSMSFKRNVVASFLGQGWSALMSLAFVPVYISYLGMEAYGLLGLFALLQAWLALLDMGMSPTLTREAARFEAGHHSAQSIGDLLRSMEFLALGLAIIIFSGIAVSASALTQHWLRAEVLPHDVVAHAIRVGGFIIAMRFVEAVYRGAIYGLQRQVWFNAVNAALATVRSVGAIAVLGWVEPTIDAFLWWQALLATAPVALYAWKVRSVLPSPPRPARFSTDALSQVGRFAGGMMLTTLTVLLLTQVDKVLLSRLLTLESFGYYTLASAIAGALYMLLGPINAATYPRFVMLATKSEAGELASFYHFVAQLVTVVLAPVALLLAIHAKGVLFAWSGDTALAGQVAPILSVLAVGTLLNAFMQVPHSVQLAHGWTSLANQANAIAIAVLVPATWWLVPIYGAQAAALIWALLNAAYVIFTAPVMFRRLLRTEMQSWYVRDMALPICGVLVVFALSWPLSPKRYEDRWLWLVFLVSITLLAWTAAALIAPTVRARLPRWNPAAAT